MLARSANPPDIVRLPVPSGLSCAVLHPRMEVHTATARQLLGDTVKLGDAIRQWANVGGLVAALYTNMTLVALLLANGHHAFLRALVDSYASLPVGDPRVAGTLVGPLVDEAAFTAMQSALLVARAAALADRPLRIERRTAHAVDHPIGFAEGAYLSALFARVP